MFKCDLGTISVCMDKKVYVSSGNMIVQCDLDGSGQVGLPRINQTIKGVAVNPQGIIAAAYDYFGKCVVLFDRDFNTVGQFSRIAGGNFGSPAGIATGQSGDFYVLDQYRDQVIRFHPEGVRCGIYQIPMEPAGPNGELNHLRVCEKNRTIYLTGANPLIRCYSIDSPEWKFTCKKLWEIKTEGSEGNSSWKWGYGGYDVDDDGILYVMEGNDGVIKCYDKDGKPLKDIKLDMKDEFKPVSGKYKDMRVFNKEIFVKRSHGTEMFQRYDLATGQQKNVVSAPVDFTAIMREPKDPAAGILIKPVESDLGIPAGRKTMRVLFIGNSQFNCIGDIPDIVEELSRSVTDKNAPLILASEVAIGGVGLEGYWKTALPQKRIAAGGWDWVVVNDIIYSFGTTNTAKFQEFGRKFNDAAKKTGAKMLFVATGEQESKKTEAEKMYTDALALAKEVQGRAAGSGMAWNKAWAKDPKLDFWYSDRAHPNMRGCYINSCVIFSALCDISPVGLSPYAELSTFPEGKDMSARTDKTAISGDIPLLQKAAWDQYQDDRKNEKNK